LIKRFAGVGDTLEHCALLPEPRRMLKDRCHADEK
jgi:hypothetical protein